MVRRLFTYPEQLGGFAEMLWMVLQYLGWTQRPLFQVDHEEIEGQIVGYRASVLVYSRGNRNSQPIREVASRVRMEDALQDAARAALGEVRQQFAFQLRDSPYRFVPYSCGLDRRQMVVSSRTCDDPCLVTTVDLVTILSFCFDRLRMEHQDLRLRLLDQGEPSHQNTTAEQITASGADRRKGKTKIVPCAGDQSTGPGAIRRRVGDARSYRKEFRPRVAPTNQADKTPVWKDKNVIIIRTKGESSTLAAATTKERSREDEESEEDPEEREPNSTPSNGDERSA